MEIELELKPERIDDPSDEGNEEERERNHSHVLIPSSGRRKKIGGFRFK